MAEERFKSFQEFWPFYLGEHSHPLNRKLHVIGVGLLLIWASYCAAIQCWIGLWLCPVIGYGFAWFGHFFIQKNRPATFKYPLWSLIGDFKMFFYYVTGRL